ncbi:MAG: hypothetical protein RJA31_906 [Actinomycetota bacterium]|jgi:hypothetical protein
MFGSFADGETTSLGVTGQARFEGANDAPFTSNVTT